MNTFDRERLERRAALAADEKKFFDNLRAREASEAAPSDATVLATNVRDMSQAEFRTFEARGGPQRTVEAVVRRARREAAAAPPAPPAPAVPPAPPAPAPEPTAERLAALSKREAELLPQYEQHRKELVEIQREKRALAQLKG